MPSRFIVKENLHNRSVVAIKEAQTNIISSLPSFLRKKAAVGADSISARFLFVQMILFFMGRRGAVPYEL